MNDRNVDLPAVEVQALTDDLPNREARRRLAFNPGGPEGGGDDVGSWALQGSASY